MPNFFEFSIKTSQRNDFIDITDKIHKSIMESGIIDGICVIFNPHTTAGITINENADPDVTYDINTHLRKIIPENSGFRHSEGNSDAHIKSSLTGSSLSLIIQNGKLILGTWQGIYFTEFDGPRTRKFYVKCIRSI